MTEPHNADSEYVKIDRGMRGKYGWEIKVCPKEGKVLSEADLERLKGIDNWVKEHYSSELEVV